MMHEKPEAELIRDVLAGELEAFSVLVKRYQDYAYGVAIGVLSDFDLARDVVQEAFLCAFRELRKLKDPARFSGWLRGIVRHTAFRALRELQRVRKMAEELGRTIEPVPTAPSPVQEAQEAERRKIVRCALERLNDKNREAVSLYYVDGLSYEDIAGFLGVTQATVQGRLQRGRAKLRKEMLTMVEETFKEQELADDFSDEIKRLLEAAAVRGREHEEAIKRLAEIGAPAVDPLCEALGDSRVPVRRAAAAALCLIGDPGALRPVLRLLYADANWPILDDVFISGRVLRIPGAREELIRVLSEGAEVDTYHITQALAKATGDDAVHDCLVAVARDPARPQGLRAQAAWAACVVRPAVADVVLSQVLADPKLGRRALGTWYWALCHGRRVSIETCLSVFDRHAAPAVRGMAGRLVLRHGDEGLRTLKELLRSGAPDQRATAALALAPDRHADVFEVLLNELVHGYAAPKWRRTVSRSLVWRYSEELAAWAGRTEADVRDCHALARALAQVRIAAGAETAEDLLRFGTPSVRAAAVRKLARTKGRPFLPELRQYLREGRPRKVAQEAFWQVYRLRDAAMPVVLEMLDSEHWTERKAALCLLRRWGKLTREQKKCGESDSHIAVRHAANWHPGYLRVHPKWGRPSRKVRQSR